jgi:hypothetical protein
MNAIAQARYAARCLLREALPAWQWFPVSDLTLEMWLKSEIRTGRHDADWQESAQTMYFYLANQNDPDCITQKGQ